MATELPRQVRLGPLDSPRDQISALNEMARIVNQLLEVVREMKVKTDALP